jgi:glycosyltransferase involved in cell wall biosynthesis
MFQHKYVADGQLFRQPSTFWRKAHMKAKVMIIEGCDFSSFPVGGQLSHAKQWVQIFGDRLALVGISIDDTPVGEWTKKKFDGVLLDYFSIGRANPLIKKPLIPRRLSVLLRLKRYKKQILSFGIESAFILAPEVMIATSDWGLHLCYKFSGVENPLAMPRYPGGKLLAARFDKLLFSALANNVELILAAADKNAIKELVFRSNGILNSAKIVQFPTRVDTKIFNVNRATTPDAQPVFVTCGRLNRVKGWDFILDAFRLVKNELPLSRLYFVGDGEDRTVMETHIAEAGLQGSVTITGFTDPVTVAGLLNSSNVFLLGSYREGWPTAMLEALACGLPVVTTNVSGAGDLIEEHSNGYVVRTRDVREFASRMIAALELNNPNPVSVEIAQRYALDKLESYLEAMWQALRG